MEIHNDMQDRSFAFLLGAGASKPSGIPTGTELVELWLKELHERHELDPKLHPLEKWATAAALEIEGFEYSRAASFYPQVFERRFRNDPDEGNAYLEKIMDKAEPSFGYSVLAQILVKTRHSIVITTNFDDLVADALSMFAHKRPLVCGHESLAGFIRPQMRRPLVAKIHRDLLLAPKNDSAGVSNLGAGWKDALSKLLKHYVIVAIGYDGNDGSLMDLLDQIEPEGFAGRIFWCYWQKGGGPDQRVLNLLSAKKGVMIPIAGFDELMLLLNERLGYQLQAEEIEKQAKVRASAYRDSFEAIRERVKPKPGASGEKKEELEAVAKLAESQSGWWGWELKARSESDPEKREQIYRDGLEEFRDSPDLMNRFANFLYDVREKYDKAERLYRRALELAPDDAAINCNLANLLTNVRRNYDEAERLYRRALELAPDNAAIMDYLATLLYNVRKNYDEAEALYRRAIELEPDNAYTMTNVASFNLARGMISEAKKIAGRAWPLCAKDHIQAAVEVALDRGLISRIEQRDDTPALGRIKMMLVSGFRRGKWSFESMLAIAAEKLSADDNRLYAALAAAILDADKVATLEEFPRWKAVEPIALDVPWPD